MNESEPARCHELLGVSLGCSPEDLERAFGLKNAALNQGGDAGERERLRLAYNAVAAHLRARFHRQRMVEGKPTQGMMSGGPTPISAPATPPDLAPGRVRNDEVLPLFAFDNWRVNLTVPPLLLGLVWLVNQSPFSFFLRGFQVWMHEFGHATAAWLCGRRALPLPFGWTPVEPEFSPFVYFGLLLLFGILFVAGWKERKIWPMLAALGLALLQFFMTWRLTELRQEFWWSAFGGVGGEFYLSALFMAFFFVELPEKFRWGMCRYVFFLIGATAFLNITGFWNQVYHGLEQIPFGTMINGEDDEGGDMNKLMDIYGWTQKDIRQNYQFLGRWCWIFLGLMSAGFAFRLNRIADKIAVQFAEKFRTDQDTLSS